MGVSKRKTLKSRHTKPENSKKMHFKNSQDFEKLFQQMGPLMMDLFPDQEYGPYMFTRKCRSPNRKDNCQFKNSNSSDKKNPDTYQIRVPLKIYDPSQVKISINDKGLMTISANNEIEKETNRNGMRKTINILEETIQLPDYLLSDLSAIEKKNDDSVVQNSSTSKNNSTEQSDSPKKLKFISKVTTKFERGELIITVPNKPEEKKVGEKKEEKNDKGPVDIQIEFV